MGRTDEFSGPESPKDTSCGCRPGRDDLPVAPRWGLGHHLPGGHGRQRLADDLRLLHAQLPPRRNAREHGCHPRAQPPLAGNPGGDPDPDSHGRQRLRGRAARPHLDVCCPRARGGSGRLRRDDQGGVWAHPGGLVCWRAHRLGPLLQASCRAGCTRRRHRRPPGRCISGSARWNSRAGEQPAAGLPARDLRTACFCRRGHPVCDKRGCLA